MKPGIHPKYQKTKVICACGVEFETRSTVPEIRVEVCSKCHPFFTGQQKFIDTAGRVQKFRRKYGLEESEEEKARSEVEVKAQARESLEELSGEVETEKGPEAVGGEANQAGEQSGEQEEK